MSSVQSRRRLTLVVAAAAVATAAAASPAMASQSARVCPTAAVSHPFAPWGDVADYELAPHGDVEDVADASFRFRPQGTGVWSDDDLYVDPIRMP